MYFFFLLSLQQQGRLRVNVGEVERSQGSRRSAGFQNELQQTEGRRLPPNRSISQQLDTDDHMTLYKRYVRSISNSNWENISSLASNLIEFMQFHLMSNGNRRYDCKLRARVCVCVWLSLTSCDPELGEWMTGWKEWGGISIEVEWQLRGSGGQGIAVSVRTSFKIGFETL